MNEQTGTGQQPQNEVAHNDDNDRIIDALAHIGWKIFEREGKFYCDAVVKGKSAISPACDTLDECVMKASMAVILSRSLDPTLPERFRVRLEAAMSPDERELSSMYSKMRERTMEHAIDQAKKLVAGEPTIAEIPQDLRDMQARIAELKASIEKARQEKKLVGDRNAEASEIAEAVLKRIAAGSAASVKK